MDDLSVWNVGIGIVNLGFVVFWSLHTFRSLRRERGEDCSHSVYAEIVLKFVAREVAEFFDRWREEWCSCAEGGGQTDAESRWGAFCSDLTRIESTLCTIIRPFERGISDSVEREFEGLQDDVSAWLEDPADGTDARRARISDRQARLLALIISYVAPGPLAARSRRQAADVGGKSKAAARR